MSEILRSDTSYISFTEKLEIIRGNILMMCSDDSEAVALANAISVHLSLEHSGERDVNKWIEGYSTESIEIAEEHIDYLNSKEERDSQFNGSESSPLFDTVS